MPEQADSTRCSLAYDRAMPEPDSSCSLRVEPPRFAARVLSICGAHDPAPGREEHVGAPPRLVIAPHALGLVDEPIFILKSRREERMWVRT